MTPLPTLPLAGGREKKEGRPSLLLRSPGPGFLDAVPAEFLALLALQTLLVSLLGAFDGLRAALPGGRRFRRCRRRTGRGRRGRLREGCARENERSDGGRDRAGRDGCHGNIL